MEAYSKKIKEYRKLNKLSLGKLSRQLGCTRQAVSLWEHGKTAPRLDWLIENAAKSEFHRMVLEALYPNITVDA